MEPWDPQEHLGADAAASANASQPKQARKMFKTFVTRSWTGMMRVGTPSSK